MKECTNKLLELIRENPELPVLPMVDGEVTGDDCGYWLGAWGSATCEEYLVTPDRVLFKSVDDVFDTLERFLPDSEFDKLPNEESKCRNIYDNLPWKKAIVVYITTWDGE